MRLGATLLVLAVLLAAYPAAAGPKLLSDEELDQITAQGVEFQLLMTPEEQSLNFSFDLGSTFGSGSATTTPISAPSTLTLNGNPNLSIFHVDNLILNLNVCVSCNAQTITQQGLGLPITINFKP